MHALVMFLTEIMLGQVDRTSKRLTDQVWWRIPIYLIIFGSAIWVAVSSAMLWTSEKYPGVVGLVAFVRHGGPAWLLSIPLVALLTVLIGSIPAGGRYGLVLLFQAATFWLTLLGMATFQGDGHSNLNMAAVSSMLVTIPATLLAVITAFADTPPIDAPFAFATMIYFGRLGHLRALAASARRIGWDVEMPARPSLALTVTGYYGSGRHVRAVSGASYNLSHAGGNTSSYWYHVTVTSSYPLPGFNISRKKIPPEYISRAATGSIPGGLNFYVIPQYGRRIPDSWTQRFGQQVAAGRPFFPSGRARVELTPGGIIYSFSSQYRLSAKLGQLEPLVDWLVGVATLLEEIAPAVEDLTPQPNYEYVPRLPYGRISEVDPNPRSW